MTGRKQWIGIREWRGAESNRRRHDFQSCALPTELPRLRKQIIGYRPVARVVLWIALRFNTRWGILLACSAAIAAVVAGCGEQGKKLDGALSYLPADAPLVITVDTDADGDQLQNLDSLASATPGWELIKQQILAIVGLDEGIFAGDIKTWLGNEMVIGSGSISDLGSGKIVSVLKATDGSALREFAQDTGRSGLERVGKYRDARLYARFDGGLTVAIDDDVILMSVSREAIKNAIDTNRSGSAFDEEKITDATGVSGHRIAKLYLDIQQLIDKPRGSGETQDLSKVAWLGSLTTLGVSAETGEKELTFDLRLESNGSDLSPADIPIATGTRSPRLLAAPGGYLSAGLRDLTRPIRFAEDVVRALDPKSYERYGQAKRVIRRMFGVDIDQDVIEQLEGDTAIVAGRNGVGAKIDIESSSRMQRSLGQTIPIITSFLKAVGLAKNPKIKHRRVGRTVIYEIRDGNRLIARYGVVGDVLAIGVGKTSPFKIKTERVKRSDIDNGRGSLLVSIDVGRALDTVLADRVPQLISNYLDFLNIRISGSVKATTELIEGRVTYKVG